MSTPVDEAMAHDTTELRCDIPSDLMRRLDAVAQSKGYRHRGEYVISLVAREVEKEIHAATLLCRMAGVNPAVSEQHRKGAA